ncbi:MAG: hypothetical protein GEV05_26070 [Betaproteobacteria bacterium]|nr:hypothetical protein [Betaproteobacteria bacterium]
MLALLSAHSAVLLAAPKGAGVPETGEAFWLRFANRDIHQCPRCRIGRMIVLATILAANRDDQVLPQPP